MSDGQKWAILPKKADFIVIAVFLVLALVLYGAKAVTQRGGDTVEVYIDGAFYTALPLDKNTIFEPPGKAVKIEVRDGKAGFTQSDCPDKVCIHTGFISISGQTAVCLPNGVSIVIRRRSDSGVDTVA